MKKPPRVWSTPAARHRRLVPMPRDSIALLTKNESRDITEQMHTVGSDYAALVLKAYDGEAWRSLGHPSWAAYIEAEQFPFSRQRSYQLVEQGRAEMLLSEAAGEPVNVTQRDAAVFRRAGPERQQQAIERVRTGETSTAEIARMKAEQRATVTSARFEGGGFSDAPDGVFPDEVEARCEHEPVMVCRHCGEPMEMNTAGLIEPSR